MGVAEWFHVFCDNIQIQDRTTVSVRYKSITKRLNIDFWTTDSDTSHSLYVGSYGRNTAIHSTSDFDMIFQLPCLYYERYNKYSSNGQSALLQEVRASIKKTYPSTDIGADGQVIEVSFADGMTFQVVPAFINNDNSYTYPDSNDGGRWKITNPKPEIEAIRERNGTCNNNLIPLCRMMRSWKKEWGVPLGGLLIDTLAYQFIIDWKYKAESYLYYDYMCRDFSAYMARQNIDQEYWKAPGSGQRVCRGKSHFQYKAKRFYNIAREAISLETATPKQEYSAKCKWREIFGKAFPL